MPPATRLEPATALERAKIPQPRVDRQTDISTAATVAAIRPATWNVGLPAERDAPIPAGPADHLDGR